MNCEYCHTEVKDHNQNFYRCPNCAVLKRKPGVEGLKWSIIAVVTTVVILSLGASPALACCGGWGGYGVNQYYGGQQIGCGAFCAGQQDAIYDHQQGFQYNPYPLQCCHSPDYRDNFQQGYDQQWGSYQSQDSTQGTSININGNNNYVSTNQANNQQQSPLQQLAHVACGFLNCGPQQGYAQPYQQSSYGEGP